MSHDVSPSQRPSSLDEIGRLTIDARALASPYGKVNRLIVSRVRGGLRFRTTDGPTHVHGEDLWALRAMLQELPEELFVEPHPAVKIPRWTEGDRVLVIERKETATFERFSSTWKLTDGNPALWQAWTTDAVISAFLDDPSPTRADRGGLVKVLDQASGLDL